MKILCDIDGVLAQFTEHLSNYLCARGFMYRVNDFNTYNLKDVLKKEDWRLMDAACHDKDWCWHVPRYEGAQQFLRDLVAKGHEVMLVTSPWNGPHWVEARTKWVESLLCPLELKGVKWLFVSPEERCELPGDLLIDDRPATIETWVKTRHGDGKLCALLVDRPWNRSLGVDGWINREAKTIGKRVHSYKEILENL